MSTPTTTASVALAARNATFEKARNVLGWDKAHACGKYSMKWRCTFPHIQMAYERDCERAKAKYHATRASAQEEYLKVLASIAAQEPEWEPGLD